MIKFEKLLFEKQYRDAHNSPRKRIIHRFHEKDEDLLQRMLNTGHPGSYCQPHKHENPDKREVFILLTGKCAVVEFDQDGNIADYIVLDHKTQTIGVEIKAKVYHTMIILEKNTSLYELKDGPYSLNDDKNFAPWAPKEGDSNANDYLESLIEKLNL